MFVLERLLRNLSEKGEGRILAGSVYDEMISKIEEWRNEKIISSEYHERFRMIVLPYLKEAVSNLIGFADIENNLKVFLFAYDHKMELTRREIDWTAVMKRLNEKGEMNKGIMVRLLRYLRVKGKERELEEIGLLMTNSLNKLLQDVNSISFVLQVLQSFPPKHFDDNPVIESDLLKLLRSHKANDRLKAMAIKLLGEKCGFEDEEEIKRMLGKGNYEKSAILISSLNLDSKTSVPISSSKVVNLRNGHFEQFSDVEKSILDGKIVRDSDCFSGYEELLCALVLKKVESDGNVLRYLLKTDLISVTEFIEKAEVMNVYDYEMICDKSNDPEIIFKYLKLVPTLSQKLKEKVIVGSIDAEDVESLSLPAQWHIFQQLGDKRERKDEAELLYLKYKNNFDGSGEMFNLNDKQV